VVDTYAAEHDFRYGDWSEMPHVDAF